MKTLSDFLDAATLTREAFVARHGYPLLVVVRGVDRLPAALHAAYAGSVTPEYVDGDAPGAAGLAGPAVLAVFPVVQRAGGAAGGVIRIGRSRAADIVL